jgi:hypothetical protein
LIETAAAGLRGGGVTNVAPFNRTGGWTVRTSVTRAASGSMSE